MATPTKTRLKAKAQIDVPQSLDEAAQFIKKIGDMNRQMLRDLAEMNDAIAHITQTYQPRLDLQKNNISQCSEGLQSWCEANRDTLTNGGKTKTANLVTGEVSWRCDSPSVRVTDEESVINVLRKLGLERFVREGKASVNKEAIKSEPEGIQGIPGLSIISKREQFIITPFEQDAA